MPGRPTIAPALERLDELCRRLRQECPWDREQDARSIVPHTVEEAYELADAAIAGDDGRQLDELGDVLFQVHFLALLLEERGVGDLGIVADHCAEKLIRRHPHVFGQARALTAGEVLANWDKIKHAEPGREPGIFGELPENLPGPLLARKAQRRAAATGFCGPPVEEALIAVADQAQRLALTDEPADQFEAVGDLLFAAINAGRGLAVDPELALRAATARFRRRVERGAAIAQAAGERWSELPYERQLERYAQARLEEPPPGDSQ